MENGGDDDDEDNRRHNNDVLDYDDDDDDSDCRFVAALILHPSSPPSLSIADGGRVT